MEFSLIPRNADGERINHCDAPVSAAVKRVEASSAVPGALRGGNAGEGEPIKVNLTCSVDLHATYTLYIDPGVADGTYLLSAWMGGEDVLHSPLAFSVRPGVSAKSSVLSGPGLKGAIAGVAADVYLKLMMHSGVAAHDCREPVYLVAVEQRIAAPPPALQGNTSALHKSYGGEVEQCSGGTYHLTYTVTAAGNYSVSVLIGKHRDLVGSEAVDVEVVPGRLSSQHCGVVGDKLGSGVFLFGSLCRFECGPPPPLTSTAHFVLL